MTSFLQLALALAVVITAAKFGGYLSYRIGQPAVLGELIAGILLGPSVLNFLHLPFFTSEILPETIHELAEIGVLLLMFLAGIDLHIADLARAGRVSALAGVLGVILPLTLGAGVGLLFNASLETSIFIGLILSATSVSISAQTLMELNVLRSRVGISLLGAAVFDDILVILGLSIFLALTGPVSGGLQSILWIVLQMALYLGIAGAVGYIILPRLSFRAANLPVSQGVITFTLVVILLYGWAAETLGSMAAITGSFLAGLALSRSRVKERISSGIATMAYSFFVPIFFINVGLSANARDLVGPSIWLFIVMTLVAVVGKVAGAGAGGLWSGFSRREALQLGVGMMSRGEVGLIVASVGITQGLINQEVFAAVVGVVIITTLLTPPFLRLLFPKAAPPQGQISESVETA
ncbi:MAG: cation:proton antiporter [Chloroflexi bacterium]|jgi:Kef-type K+ transport system membrane component KefB|nr:cation:proton antiporter [Chloroflexota bacterium]